MLETTEIKQGRKNTILRCFVAAMILLIPAFILNRAMTQYLVEWRQNDVNAKTNNAKLIMADIQGEMSEQYVVQKALDRFAEQFKNLNGSKLSPQLAAEGTRLFFRHWPKSSTLLWLNQDYLLVTPEGFPEPEQKKVWQAFIKTILAPGRVSPFEKKLADNLVKSSVSGFLDISFFSRLTNGCVQIMFKGKRCYIALLKLARQGSLSSDMYLMALIPSEKTKENWLEERAIRLARKNQQIAGAFFISSNNVIEGSAISDNLLHGLHTNYVSGQRHMVQENTFFFGETHFSNPDLFISVGIRESSESQFWQAFITIIAKFVWFPSLAFLILPLSGLRSVNLELSLKTRFRFTAISVVAFPLLLTGILGAIHTARVSLEAINSDFRAMERELNRLEENVALKTVNFETFLKNELPTKFSSFELGQDMAGMLYAELKPDGCEALIMITPDGNSFFASDFPIENIRQRVSYQISFIRDKMIADGFNIERLEKTFPPPARGFNIDKLKEDGPNFRQDLHDHFVRVEMGGRLFSSFTTYIKDPAGKILACLAIGFDYRAMQQNFLAALKPQLKAPEMSIFITSQLPNGFSARPAAARLRNILDLTMLTSDSFQFNQSWKNNDYLVYSRPLKGLENAAMAVWKKSNVELSPEREQLLVLLVTFISSILAALLIIGFFDQLFLKPVLFLSRLAGKVESGDYAKLPESGDNSEIGILSQNFAQMIQGLKEKAEMKNYMRQDLFEQALTTKEATSSRRESTIMFAGIRNFSALEVTLAPEEAMSIMSNFLTLCEKSVRENGGEIDKFIGDTAMATFNMSAAPEMPEIRAVKAAMQIKMELRQDVDLRRLTTGIGIACGTVIAGNIGSLDKRLDYTCIGDTVNLAARLEKLAGRNGNPQILTTYELFTACTDAFTAEELPPVAVKGKAQPIRVMAITG